MLIFKETGWDLPVRSKIHLKTEKCSKWHFIEGETKDKMMSPKQIEKIIRQKLQVSKYVTLKQIRSLFAWWSSMHRQEKLKEPTDNQTQKNVDNPHDKNDSDYEEDNTKLETEEVIRQCVLLQ